MRKCLSCGKKGFFLFVNSEGLCKPCAEAALIAKQEAEIRIEKEERKKSEIYFYEIINMFASIKEDIDAKDNPISQLDLIPIINKKIELCDKLVSYLSGYANYKYLSDYFLSKITDSTVRGIKKIDCLSLSLYISENSEFSLLKAISDIKKNCNTYKQGWQDTITRIENNAQFEEKLLSLNNYDILLSNEIFPKLSVEEKLIQIKFSNITSRTDYEKLGTFVVIDTETTGLKCAQNEIIEVAAILFENWIPTHKFETLLKPKKEIPSEITSLTGISQEMVVSAPNFMQIIPSLHAFIGKNNIVGHNLDFDMRFWIKNGFDFLTYKRKYYDTLELSRKVLHSPSKKWDSFSESYEIDYSKDYDVENYKLTTLCDYFDIRDNEHSHRALSDCLATGYLFRKLAYRKINL